jgi:hypothetical protein
VTFSDRFGGARVCRAGDLDTHIFFPPAVDADLLVAGLPAGYRDITLSYQIASVGTGNVRANLIRVYAGSVNLTSSVTVGTALPDRYVGVSIDLPDGVTSLRFVSDGGTNIHGMRLDNIRLSGRR